MRENHFSKWPVILYGFVLCMAAVAYYFLASCLTGIHGKESILAIALGKDRKSILSVVIYLIGIGLSFIDPVLGCILYVIVACIWFIPDKRIEKVGEDKMAHKEE